MADGRTGLLLTFARRGEDAAIRQAVSRLRADGATSVIAVGTPVSSPALSLLGVDDIAVYGDGRRAWAVICDLRRRRPAMAAVVYSDAGCAGHLKLEALALLSGATRVQRIAPAGGSAIGRASLAAVVLAKGLCACGCAVVGAAICTVALVCLTLRQMAAGGSRASRP
jgi:hypothetical protein